MLGEGTGDITVKCADCGRTHPMTVTPEQLREGYARHPDGVSYIDLEEPYCTECLEHPDENTAEQARDREAQLQRAQSESRQFEQSLYDEGLLDLYYEG